MKKYGMFLKNGKDLIHITHQETLHQPKQYFAEVKKMLVEDFIKIFVVTEIKTRNFHN